MSDKPEFDYDACPVDEKGHRWAVTRDGNRVRLLCNDAAGPQPIAGTIGNSVALWCTDGSYFTGKARTSMLDLLTPKPEPLVTWQNWYETSSGKIIVYYFETQEEADTCDKGRISRDMRSRIGNKAHRVEIER